MSAVNERRLGALIGAAVGDALGVTYEFMAPSAIKFDRLEMIGGGPFQFSPGEVSDDTDLLHAALGAYRARDEFDPDRMVANMLRWLDRGPPDVGNQTRSALVTWRRGGPPRPDEAAQGNGGLMRAAAHALSCDDAATAGRFASMDTWLTHPSHVAGDCSAFYAATLWRMIDGADVNAALEADAGGSPRFESYEWAVPSPGGHCVHSLRLALWAARSAKTFEEGVTAVVRAGGDTDTNATIAGGLLGARFGLDAIPQDWREALAPDNRDRLMKEAERLRM